MSYWTGYWKIWDQAPSPYCVSLGRSLNLPNSKITCHIDLSFYQLSIYFFSGPNSWICSQCFEDEAESPLNISLPAGTMLSFVSRGQWRDIAEGRGFPSWLRGVGSASVCGTHCFSSSQLSLSHFFFLPAPSFCIKHGFSRPWVPRWTVDSSFPQRPLIRAVLYQCRR